MSAPAPPHSGYIGRFAPSPTGPLHLGSLLAAVASYLDARAAGGRWLLRIDDLDPPREVAGASEQILHSLRAHGLHWDGEVVYQSLRHPAYAAALEQLRARGMLYRCDCIRARLRELRAYDGRCRDRGDAVAEPCALRLRVPEHCSITIADALQGNYTQNLSEDGGDFVVRRKDGLYAYQLAVAVDDAWQHITDVVRGSDLLPSTPRQVLLQQQLGLPTPRYAHLPVLTDSTGCKLSKQSFARPLDDSRALDNLRRVLAALGQGAAAAHASSPTELLAIAAADWQRHRIPRCAALPIAT